MNRKRRSTLFQEHVRLEVSSLRNQTPKILFLVTEDWYFWSHRLPVARAARQAGAGVYVMTRVNTRKAELEKEDFQIVPWTRLSRGSLNPLRELAAFLQVFFAYRRLRPDIAHHVALKPVVYGGLAARLLGIPSVNAITGLGHTFTSRSWRMRLLSRALSTCLRLAMKRRGSKVIFQNSDDKKAFVDAGIVYSGSGVLIRGSGVDVDTFMPSPEPCQKPVVMLPTRMLWQKGVGEFVAAARRLKAEGVEARFVLVGDTDIENPGAISEDQLRDWADSGEVEFWGYRSNMPAILARSNIVCLPSYREGVPKVLIEASACARAAITTDVPGCCEIVRHGSNGLLVPPRDSRALARAIKQLLIDPELRARLGSRGREIVVQEFSEQLVVRQTLAVYGDLLGSRWPGVLMGPNSVASTLKVPEQQRNEVLSRAIT